MLTNAQALSETDPTTLADPAAPAAPAGPTLVSNDPGAKIANLLMNSAAVRSMQEGQLPAVYLSEQMFGESANDVMGLLRSELPKLGLGISHATKSNLFVVYNPQQLTSEQIASADAADQIGNIALDGAELERQSQAAQQPPEAPLPAAGPAPTTVPVPASAQNKLQTARIDAMTPQAPSQQLNPSQGLVNGLRQRAF